MKEWTEGDLGRARGMKEGTMGWLGVRLGQVT